MTGPPPKPIDLAFLRDRTAQRRIALATVALGAAGLLYGFVGPRWYTSVFTVVPVKQQSGGSLSTLLGGDMGGLAASIAGVGGATADAARISAVLQSIAVSDAIIEKFDLRERYDVKDQESAREELWKHCDVRTLPKPNLVKLSCEDRDPRRAQEMVGLFAEIGNQAFRRVSVSSASEEVRFLDRRVVELRKQADDVATRMREFQEAHQIVDLDSQARALVTSVAAVNAQRISKKMELDYARGFATRDEASTRQLESQLSVMNDALRDLEVPRDEPAPASASASPGKVGAKGLFPAAMAVPRLRSEYEKLYRDRKVAEATLIFALDRLEGARASEARDVSTFQILDPPTLATRKSRPRGSIWALIGAMVGLAGSVGVEWWRSRRGVA